jgi:hypothetical protein
MRNKRYLLKLKPPELSFQSIIAATAEIYGDHLALVNAEGKLAALFLLDVVQGWVEIEEQPAAVSAIARH